MHLKFKAELGRIQVVNLDIFTLWNPGKGRVDVCNRNEVVKASIAKGYNPNMLMSDIAKAIANGEKLFDVDKWIADDDQRS